jgi:hypothetical protein
MIDESERFEATESDDLRSKLNTGVLKRKMASGSADDDVKEELQATQRQLQKVTEEMEKLREEMITIQARGGVRYALGYDPAELNKMKFTESLQWVTTTLSIRMKSEMEKFPEYFRIIHLIGDISDIGNKACAGYNRGIPCRNKWHTFNRAATNRKPESEDLRLHCCALCMEALGILSGHPLVECPWTREATWSIIQA